MVLPREKLAQSLEVLKKLQDAGVVAIASKQMTRTHRERLLKLGFIQEVMKGWYIATNDNKQKGESTPWYAAFWDFCADYLNKKFKNHWCLSPEQSISLYAGNWTVPKQLLVRAPKGSNKILNLPYRTSLLEARYFIPSQNEIVNKNGLRIFSVAAALVSCSLHFFKQSPADVRSVLMLIRDASPLLNILLEGGHSVIAGRLVGALRSIKQNKIADEIAKTMQAAGYKIYEVNPFTDDPRRQVFLKQNNLPYVNRMRILWHTMREDVLKNCALPKKKVKNIEKYTKNIEEKYVTDAYNSLSIEGYRVTPELIQRVRSGVWNPENNKNDQEQVSALAARGYWQAFNAVKKSVYKIFKGKNSGKVFSEDHRDWFREMFAPSVQAGILKPSDLAGYRNQAVYIRASSYIPPSAEMVRELMPAFCELLQNETEIMVRVVLGHFFFVYIHPYMDGNGRMARFLLNAMLAAGHYSWLIIPVEMRNQYISALEEASVHANIVPFAKFINKLIG